MKFLRVLLIFLMIVVGAIVTFYLYAGSPDQSESNYQKLLTFHPAATPRDTLKVMTYNIGYLSGMKNNLAEEMPEELFRSNLEKLGGFLRTESPDIIGFQEIDFGSNRSYYQNQLDSIAESLGYHMAYASVNWDKKYVPFPYWPPKYHFGKMLSGQAILSRFPIVKQETIVLDKPLNAPFYYNRFYLDRLIQLVDVQIGEKEITLMNLHLEAFDAETRELQAFVVRDLYQEYANEVPTILMGDFNSSPFWDEDSDETMKTILSEQNIQSMITQSVYDVNPLEFYTYSSGEPFQMIDYVLYNPGFIEMISGEVHQDAGEISDHLPVSMQFTFPTENPLSKPE